MITVAVSYMTKWYGLILHDDSGYSRTVPFPDDPRDADPQGGAAFVDHTPNPRVVARWASRMGYKIDPLAWELMIGRWETEQTDRYDDELVLIWE